MIFGSLQSDVLVVFSVMALICYLVYSFGIVFRTKSLKDLPRFDFKQENLVEKVKSLYRLDVKPSHEKPIELK